MADLWAVTPIYYALPKLLNGPVYSYALGVFAFWTNLWVWVMSLFVIAWAVWYAARMWDVPASYAKTPTYRDEAASETPPGK